MGLLDNKIAIIRDNVYGEEIRTAIYEAFDMLDDESVLGKLDNVPTASEISSMIESAMSGMDIGSGVLSFKGILANGAQLNRYALNIDRKYSGIYVLGPSRSYSNLPSDFPSNANGILVNINTNDDEDVRLDAFVQIVYPLGQSFDGLYWIRTDVDEGWKAAGGGSGSSGLATKGILPDNTNLASFGTVENEGIYRTNTSYNYSGIPTGYNNSKVSILKNYVFTNSSGTVTYRIQELSYVDGTKTWIRGKTGTTNFVTSDWKEVAGSGSGGTVNPQDIEDAVFYYLEHDADLNQIIAEYIGEQGSVDETSVKGWIEGYVDKDNTSDHDGQTKFNASVNALIQAALSGYSTTDRTYATDSKLQEGVTKFVNINKNRSSNDGYKISNENATYITDAQDEYLSYADDSNNNIANEVARNAVADGVVGLAAFRMALKAIEPYRSSLDIQSSLTGFANSLPNREDTGRAISTYNQLNDASKMAVADGILGLAALKRTEWFPTPQMYGAYADGVHDDKNAIQEAITANEGKTLYFPAGTYMISNTLFIKGTNEEYTDIIMDPSACIKATQYWGGYQQDGTTPVAQQGGFMVMIGERTPHDITYNKARKKIFMGGVLDSNTRAAYGTYGYIAGIMQVNPDVTDFDLSETVFMATNTATGFALGDNTWYTAKGELSTDAYIHHISLRKYSWNDAADPKVGTSSEKNRASGISVHTSDNNFENIRVYYFKRNVKITHGSGNYFSDVHTLGTAFNVYDKDSSGFFLENKTRITLDQCYVDADNHFLYVADEAAGSEIYVSQCMHYQYGGSGGANRTMTAFYLGSANYTDSSKLGYNLVSRLDVNQFTMIPNSKTGEETNDIGRHQGIAVSSSTNDGSYFAMQTHKYNLSLNRINILAPHKLKRGDMLRGALGGERGSVLLLRTTLARLNDNSLCSKWHEVCSIPVSNGPNGKISYRISIIFDGYYLTFPLAIYKNKTVTDNNHLAISIGSQKIETDDEREYEIGFTYENGPTTPYAYTMWIRMINAKYSTNSFYSRAIEEVIFDSKTSITPSACQTGRNGFTVLNSTTSTPSFVKFNTDKTVILINCKTPSIRYLTAPTTQ